MADYPNGTIVNEDITRLILLTLDHFYTTKLELEYGKSLIQVHESDYDEYKFLSHASIKELFAVKRDDIVFPKLLKVKMPTKDDVMAAVVFGRIDLLEKFKKTYLENNPISEELATIRGNTYLENDLISEELVDIAVERGQLDVIKWLEDQNVYIHDGSVDAAARSGNLEVLKFVSEPYGYLNDEREDIEEIVEGIAVSYGNIQILDWLWDKGFRPTNEWPTMQSKVVRLHLSNGWSIMESNLHPSMMYTLIAMI